MASGQKDLKEHDSTTDVEVKETSEEQSIVSDDADNLLRNSPSSST
jgi:hypothetical protein